MLSLLKLLADNPPQTVSPINIGPLPHVDTGANQVQAILDTTFGVIGAISVLMFAIGGLRYITAQGDPQQISKAKQTLIYAVVGIVVAILAVAIVTFTLGNVV